MVCPTVQNIWTRFVLSVNDLSLNSQAEAGNQTVAIKVTNQKKITRALEEATNQKSLEELG